MKFRAFELRDDITQAEYIDFRNYVEEHRPASWTKIETLPQEVFYYIMVVSAVKAGWVKDVIEENEYQEETVWPWSVEFIDNIPAGQAPLLEWGEPVLNRWIEYRDLDPN